MEEIKLVRNDLSKEELEECLLNIAFTLAANKQTSLKFSFDYKDHKLSINFDFEAEPLKKKSK